MISSATGAVPATTLAIGWEATLMVIAALLFLLALWEWLRLADVAAFVRPGDPIDVDAAMAKADLLKYSRTQESAADQEALEAKIDVAGCRGQVDQAARPEAVVQILVPLVPKRSRRQGGGGEVPAAAPETVLVRGGADSLEGDALPAQRPLLRFRVRPPAGPVRPQASTGSAATASGW